MPSTSTSRKTSTQPRRPRYRARGPRRPGREPASPRTSLPPARTTTRTLHACLPRHGRWSSSSMTRTTWAHVDQGLALLAVSQGDAEAGEALLDDVSRRFRELDKAAMGAAYALGLADVYRRAGRQVLAAALLRHALSLMDEAKNPEQYAQVRRATDRRRGRLLETAAEGGTTHEHRHQNDRVRALPRADPTGSIGPLQVMSGRSLSKPPSDCHSDITSWSWPRTWMPLPRTRPSTWPPQPSSTRGRSPTSSRFPAGEETNPAPARQPCPPRLSPQRRPHRRHDDLGVHRLAAPRRCRPAAGPVQATTHWAYHRFLGRLWVPTCRSAGLRTAAI